MKKIFRVPAGSPARVFKGFGLPAAMESVVTNKDADYSERDVILDPSGIKGWRTPEGRTWAKQGYFGFRLPKNSRGARWMMVHQMCVEGI
jgi:hypothetical protein